MKPTAAGEDFLAEAERLLGGAQLAMARAREAGSAAAGRLKIGTYFSASTGRFRQALMGFARQNRGVGIWLREGIGIADRSPGTAPASARRASWARPAARSRAPALPLR
jgi:DNA-binding transcriptional LysR family regulator